MKKLLTLLVVITFYAFAKAQQTPLTYHKAKIYLSSSHTLQNLKNLDVAVDHVVHKEGTFVISDFSTDEINLARQSGYKVDVLINDVASFYKSQSNRSQSQQQNTSCSTSETSYPTPVNFNQGSMGGYLTYQEFLEEVDAMAAQYPELITAKSPISDFLTEGEPDTSVTPSIGSNPIYWLKISDNPNVDETEPEILYTAIHHAREPMSLMQLVYYMWYLLENYEDNLEVKAIVDNTELYFVPVINPDGYLYNQVTDPNGGGLWRKNRKNGNGVDNNRNYDYHINGDPNNGSWGGPGSSTNPGSNTYHGTGPFSEIENQAIKWFVEQHNFVLALNNHTFGELLYYPFGYADVATADDALYQGLGAQLTSINGYTPIRDNPFAGESDDFMYGTVGTHDKIFAFTPEIGTSFWPPASDIISISQEMMFMNLTAAQVVTNYGALVETTNSFVGENTSLSTSFDLKRLGVASTGDFIVSFSPVSSNITSNGSAVNFDALAPLETASGTITYTLDPTIEIGDSIEFDLVVNNGFYDNNIRVSKVYGALTNVFLDNGDTIDSYENTSWGVTSSTFVSPSSSITDSPSGNYSDNENSSITLTDPIDLTQSTAAAISFYAKWDIENTWDYVQFEISTDNGVSWQPQCGNFTSAGTNAQPVGEPLYDGVQNDWVFEEINLSDYIGEVILARFRLVSDGAVTRDGFYYDDLNFSVITDEALQVENVNFKAGFELFPNPVKNLLTVRTSLGSYTSSVYNVLGQEVSNATVQQGNAFIDYTGLPDGIYFLRLETEENSAIFKIVKN
ncbi:M14 family zinc carboxypeptidase [uncultured Dokdonia sp.]|uniref:M14 family zinc carboxypeptidase n=1 Tax=uncultured Dokdonia sp. TaxID=575653 RepID=UPI00260E7EA1|nr:M14 family zinc carboxypeptidase [uncultured Dokdonia sp.]